MYTVQMLCSLLQQSVLQALQTDTKVMHAAGFCNAVSWSNCSHMQCGASWWEYWLLSVHVFVGVLYLSIGHSCDNYYLGKQHHSKVGRGSDNFSLELLGISSIHCWFSLPSQKSSSCLPVVAVVYMHGMACSYQMT